MRTDRTLLWLKRAALTILLSAVTDAAIAAQRPQATRPDLETTLVPGMTAWITDAAGREEKSRVVDIAGGLLTLTTGENVRRLSTADVMRVRVRHSDSVINGALIGAGAAVASGLVFCGLMEPWEVCRDNVGPLVRIGAVGAGIGIGIDALIRGRRTIYDAGKPTTWLQAAPIIDPRAKGVRVTFSF